MFRLLCALLLLVPGLALAQTVTTCDAACTVTMVVSITTPFFNLDEAGGAQIAGAVLAVWAIGWAFRVLIRTLKSTDGNSTSESES
jgi:hypothetical protein